MVRLVLPTALLASLAFVVPAQADDAADREFFEKRIRPVLAAHCYECHSGQAKKIKGELRLDHRAGWLKGGVSGPAVVPGKAGESLLIKAIRYEDKETQMPPKAKLPAAAIADLEEWVAMGAPGGDAAAAGAAADKLNIEQAKTFWSFQPLRPVRPPAVKDAGWPANDIDRFILARQEQQGLRPAPPADKRTLIRRATFDLTGLPPTPDEVNAFIRDESPQSFAKVIDRLLASPHYGERWGRHWLDVVRYADTAGETADYPVPHAWRYRNYVIDAFNSDKSYDQFLHEQIAGDILAGQLPPDASADRYAELITATGYIAIARRFGFRIEKDHHLTLEDTVDTLGKSVLGLAIGCARCHDHKYDPISMQDFYALYGIFESTRYPFPGCEHTQRPRDMMPLLSPKAMATLVKPQEAALAAAEAEYQKAKASLAAAQKKLHDTAVGTATALARGGLDNGGSHDFADRQATPGALAKIAVKKGSAFQIAISPRAHYGGDSTVIDLDIREVGGQGRRWRLVDDLVGDLHEGGRGNAHRDSHGNPHVWCLLDQRSGGLLLDRYVPNANNTPGLNLWVGSGDGFPVAGVNVNDKPIKYITIDQPARSFVVHPSNTNGGGVAVLWVSPIDGVVEVSGKVIDVDTSGGDGIAWSLEAFASPEIGGLLLALRDAAPVAAATKRKRDEAAAIMPKPELAYAVIDGVIADAKFLKRGDPEKPGDPVARRQMELFGGQRVDAKAGSGRLMLARQLTAAPTADSGDAPASAQGLVARVMVNRIWLHHFGAGIVTTPNDFGYRGQRPTHPELLEHLAHDFVRRGWSIKAMHRAIMLSKTYQQTGEGFPRRRLSAEEIRDSMLAVSGDLDRSPGQAHPFPPENTWGFTQHNPFAAVYDHSKRSVYLMVQRNRRHPYLSLFDGPDASASTGQRQPTTVPTQSLFFMNDPFVHARAASVASKLLALPDDDARLNGAYQLLYQRQPTDRERLVARELVAAYVDELKSQPAAEISQAAWAALVRVMMSANEFVYVD